MKPTKELKELMQKHTPYKLSYFRSHEKTAIRAVYRIDKQKYLVILWELKYQEAYNFECFKLIYK